MKKKITILLSMCMIASVSPVSILAAQSTASVSQNTTWESEHPPLSDITKKAIAEYKKNPTDENKQALLNAINKTYDWVIQNKKDNLQKYTQNKEQSINAWTKTICSGGMPPFMSLSTDNNKDTERQAIADAVAVYGKTHSSADLEIVKQCLANYYDAFLKEQQEHIEETEELRETRVATSLEYFTSDRFQPQMNTKITVTESDVLAEMICSYICTGAEIVPVNPEARVREREYNANITNAQMNYLNQTSEQNKVALKNEITKVFEETYTVRLEQYAIAEKKGKNAIDTLFNQMLNENFRKQQFADLTEQRNLYGRIDRMITYGSNTYEDWTPRMKEQSQQLAELIHIYEITPTDENKKAAETKFYEIYQDMIDLQKTHLENTKITINSFVEQILNDLIG